MSTLPYLGYAGWFRYLKNPESKQTNLQFVSYVSDLSYQAIDCFLPPTQQAEINIYISLTCFKFTHVCS